MDKNNEFSKTIGLLYKIYDKKGNINLKSKEIKRFIDSLFLQDDVKLNEYYNETPEYYYYFFENILYGYLSFKKLYKLYNNIDKVNAYVDVNLIKDLDTIIFNIDKMNNNISVFFSLKNKQISLENSIFDFTLDNIKKQVDLLKIKAWNNSIILANNIFYIYAIYTFLTEVQTLLFFNSLLIIYYSPFYNNKIKNITKCFYKYFKDIIHNGKILALFINIIRPYVEKEKRTKASNTTQLSIIYRYDNMDIYCMRFDLPHIGVNITHINNKSPGKCRGCLIDEEKLGELIKKYKIEKDDYFVEYNPKLYALKEMKNIEKVSQTKKEIYCMIEKDISHIPFCSDNNFTESEICDFLEKLVDYLPFVYYEKIEDIDKLSEDYFQLNYEINKISNLYFLLFDEFRQNEIDSKIIDKIKNYTDKIGLEIIEKLLVNISYDFNE